MAESVRATHVISTASVAGPWTAVAAPVTAAPAPVAPIVPPGATASSTAAATLPTSKTFWAIVGGCAVGALAQFGTWATISANGSQVGTYKLQAGGQFLVAALLGFVVYLAWPTQQGRLSAARRTGLTVVGGLAVLVTFSRLSGLSGLGTQASTELGSSGGDLSAYGIDVPAPTVSVDYGFGVYAYCLGLAAMTYGNVRAWVADPRR